MSVSIDVDLRNQFGPIRDQGSRPTCLAFAASDAHAALRPGWEELSCEYAFYYAQKRHTRPPSRGARLEDMLATLQEFGQPTEAGWPYLTRLPANLAEYEPPDHVGQVFGRNGIQQAAGVDQIIQALDTGAPAIVLTNLTRSFFTPSEGGVVENVIGDEVLPVPRHAIIAVGYGHLSHTRLLLIRNSWGPSWGLGGYAWLTAAFLARHMYGLALLKEECDVPLRSAAA